MNSILKQKRCVSVCMYVCLWMNHYALVYNAMKHVFGILHTQNYYNCIALLSKIYTIWSVHSLVK